VVSSTKNSVNSLLNYGVVVGRKILAKKNQSQFGDQITELEKRVEELNRLNNLKDRLLAIVSHDIRAPFKSVKSVLHLVANRKLEQKEFSGVMTSLEYQVESLDAFMENLLMWAKKHTDSMKPEIATVVLRDIVLETTELLSFLAKAKLLHVRVNVPVNLVVLGDIEMCKLILRNLISNAIKFCRSNDEITISAERENEMIRVLISDTGQGIPTENLEKLFGLSHLSTKGTKDEIGVGLGLTLCREFVEKLGGSIRASSVYGHGSTFEFTLPGEFRDLEVQQFRVTTAQSNAHQINKLNWHNNHNNKEF